MTYTVTNSIHHQTIIQDGIDLLSKDGNNYGNLHLQHIGESISQSNEELEFSSAANRFFSDSPYYDAFIEKEIYSADRFCTTLEDIGTKVKDFSRATATLVKSMHSLSLSCQLHDKSIQRNEDQLRGELGPENDMLHDFGETLEEIAAAHQSMYERIGMSLEYHLMESACRHINEINKLKKKKKEVETSTRFSEQKFFQYLNGKFAGGNFDNSTDTIYNRVAKLRRSSTDTSCNTSSSLSLYPPQRSWSHDFLWSRTPSPPVNNEHGVAVSDPLPGRRKFGEESDMANKLVHWKSSIEQIRVEETKAELNRFRLCKNIVYANYKRTLELSQSNADLFHAMQNCFQLCSEKLTKSLSRVHQNQQQCLDFESRVKPLWEERERSLTQNITKLRRTADLSLRSEDCSEGKIDISDIERDLEIWCLPNKLASITQFRRPSPRDVLVEGWLYQQCTTMMSLQSSWTRRWFILKSDGIYYLESSGTDGGRNNLTTKTKVKMFDIVLCTVRELHDEPSARFCFQLIDTSNKTVTFQARGPAELQMWLDCIRSAVGSQLAKFDPLTEKNSGRMMLRKESSEIRMTLMDVKSSTFWDPQKSKRFVGNPVNSRKKGSDCVKGIKNPLIAQVLEANPRCADCERDSPDWASLNLGILVCLECSGVHRSLGCHVSKVRSLTLDKLTNSEASLLLLLGNQRINDIWEGGMAPENKALKKRACLHDQMARKDFIKRKYVNKEFFDPSSAVNDKLEKEEVSKALCDATKRGDIAGMMVAIACGANSDWKINDGEEGACTALQISTRRKDNKKNGAVECTELLLQNGAK